MTIANRDNLEQNEFIGLDLLKVHSMGNKSLVFIFSHNFQAPDWLTPGTSLYIRLLYNNEETGLPRESGYFETTWGLE